VRASAANARAAGLARGALALVGALERVTDDGGERRREHDLLARELAIGTALEHEHGGGDAPAHDRHGQHRGEPLFTEAGDVLVVLVPIGDGHRHRQELLGDEARDALALAQVDAAHRIGGEAHVAAQGEDLAVACVRTSGVTHVDAHDVGGGDGRHVGAHGREHLGERLRLPGGLDEAKDAIEAAIAALVYQDRTVAFRGGGQHHL
jgi:hypothetical protein